jgi:hypothetical protein
MSYWIHHVLNMLVFTNSKHFEPYIETKYDNHIIDDRNNFILDKLNKLYL